MLIEHYVLTQDPKFSLVFAFVRTHNIKFSAHLNRTRFSLDTAEPYYLEFALRYADSCPLVEDAVSGI